MTWNFQTWSGIKADNEQKVRDAWDFLTTGNVKNRCTSSSQCGTGWACINGECTFQPAAGSENTCDTSPTGGGGCSTGAPSGCTTSNCGASGTEEECCGLRCCRFGPGAGGTVFVQCFCGNCPQYDGERCRSDSECASGKCIGGYCGRDGYCTAFCDGYYKSTGKLYPGCTQENVCDECSYCDENDPPPSCKRSTTGPCWCIGCEPNHQCNKDGNCTPSVFVSACRDFTKCGKPTGDKCCSSNPWSLETATTCLGRLIDAPCDESDKGDACGEYCENKQFSTTSGGSTVSQGNEGLQIPCLPGCKCTSQGFISVPGTTTYFYEECCYQNAPEELNCEDKECDCVKNPETCDQQCGECRLCDRNTNKCVSQTGTCPADPEEYGFIGFITGNKYGSLTIYDLDSCYFGPAQPDGIASFRATRLANNQGVCTSSSGNMPYAVGTTYNLGGVMGSYPVTVSDTVKRINGNPACGNPSGYLVRVQLG